MASKEEILERQKKRNQEAKQRLEADPNYQELRAQDSERRSNNRRARILKNKELRTQQLEVQREIRKEERQARLIALRNEFREKKEAALVINQTVKKPISKKKVSVHALEVSCQTTDGT